MGVASFTLESKYKIVFALMNIYVLRKCLGKKKKQYLKATNLKIRLFFICMSGKNNGSGFFSAMLCSSLFSI